MFLYPLAISLIFLALLGPLFNNSKIVYQGTTVFTLIAAIADGLNAFPSDLKSIGIIENFLNLADNILPFFELGMGWVIPTIIGFTISAVFVYIKTLYINYK